MSIPKGDKKIKIILLIVIVVVLAFFSAFGGLKLYALGAEKTPLKIVKSHVYEEILAQTTKKTGTMSDSSSGAVLAQKTGQTGPFIASKTGSKYHLPACPGAKQIAEKNRVIFETALAAEKAGYTPASNCPGLQTKQTSKTQ